MGPDRPAPWRGQPKFLIFDYKALYGVENDRNHQVSGYASHFQRPRIDTFQVIQVKRKFDVRVKRKILIFSKFRFYILGVIILGYYDLL